MKHKRIRQECRLTGWQFCVNLSCGRGIDWMLSWALRRRLLRLPVKHIREGLALCPVHHCSSTHWHSFQGADVQDTPRHLFLQPVQCVYCRNVLSVWELQLLLKYFILLFNYCSLLFLVGGLMMLDQTLKGNWPGLEEKDFMTWKTMPAQKMREWIAE